MLAVKRHKRSPSEWSLLCFCALTIVCMWHLRLAGLPWPPSITLSFSTQRAALRSILVPIPLPSTHPTVSLCEALKRERLKINLDLSLARVEKHLKSKNSCCSLVHVLFIIWSTLTNGHDMTSSIKGRVLSQFPLWSIKASREYAFRCSVAHLFLYQLCV